MEGSSSVFTMSALVQSSIAKQLKITCAVPISQRKHILFGMKDGLYMSSVPPGSSESSQAFEEPVMTLAMSDITQVEVLDGYDILLILSKKRIYMLSLDALDSTEPWKGLQHMVKIASDASFFRIGYCLNMTVLTTVKNGSLSTTVKMFRVNRGATHGLGNSILTSLEIYREIYIPTQVTSLHFRHMGARIVVGCPRFFELIDVETLEAQSLLDKEDPELAFVFKRKRPLKPMTIYRNGREFLLCYNELAFYIDHVGRRSRSSFIIHWKGAPTDFVYRYPYILALEPRFIEIWHMETGAMIQTIPGNHLRLLFTEAPPLLRDNTVAHWRTNDSLGRVQTVILNDDRVVTLRYVSGSRVDEDGEGSPTSTLVDPGWW